MNLFHFIKLAVKIIAVGDVVPLGGFHGQAAALRVTEDCAYSEPAGCIDVPQLSKGHVEF